MITIDSFIALVNDELGLRVTEADAGVRLEEVPDWDSVHMLWLLTILERTTGRSISMPDILEAKTLEDIYHLVSQL